MTLTRALAVHHLVLPAQASGVHYFAGSGPEGGILDVDFSLHCKAVAPMMVENRLAPVKDPLHFTYLGALLEAEDLGWQQKPGDIFAERRRGSGLDSLTMVAADGGSACHLYMEGLL